MPQGCFSRQTKTPSVGNAPPGFRERDQSVLAINEQTLWDNTLPVASVGSGGLLANGGWTANGGAAWVCDRTFYSC